MQREPSHNTPRRRHPPCRCQAYRTADKPSPASEGKCEGQVVSTSVFYTLVALPVAASCCLGMLLRSLTGRQRNAWGAWLILMAMCIAVWVYLFEWVAP